MMTPQAEVSEMSEMRAIPANEPVMVAWEAYKASPEYENTKRWARELAHTDDSLWAAFFAGFSAMRRAVQAASPQVREGAELRAAILDQASKDRAAFDALSPRLRGALERQVAALNPTSDAAEGGER